MTTDRILCGRTTAATVNQLTRCSCAVTNMVTGGREPGSMDDLVLETGSPVAQDSSELAQSDTSRVVTTDLPVRIPGHDVRSISKGPVCCHQQGESSRSGLQKSLGAEV